MDLDKFLSQEWKVSGFNDKAIELENIDGSEHVWINIDYVMGLLIKLHMQYWDEDVKSIFKI
jgi:hypothetical protein